jgi:hypothetical protein
MTFADLDNVCRRPNYVLASAAQRARIAALGGRPPADLTPRQARIAITALKRRKAQQASTLAALAS